MGVTQVILKGIDSPACATVTFEGRDYIVGPDKWVRLMDGCEVRLGRPREHWTAESRQEIRLQLEAPEYLVLRGSSYRNSRKVPL